METSFQQADEETVRQRGARTGHTATDDNLVLSIWPTRMRESTPANANNSVIAKIPTRGLCTNRSLPGSLPAKILRNSKDETGQQNSSAQPVRKATSFLEFYEVTWP